MKFHTKVHFIFSDVNVIWVSNLSSIHLVTKGVKTSTNVKSLMIFVVIQDLVLHVSTNREVSGKINRSTEDLRLEKHRGI